MATPAFVVSDSARLVRVSGSAGGQSKKGKWQPPHGLTSEQAQRIIDAAQTERNRLLVWALFATGARISEVVELRRDGLVDGKTIRLPLRKNRSKHWNDITLWPEDRELLFYLSRFRELAGTEYIFPGRGDIGHITSRAGRDAFMACSERSGVLVFQNGSMRAPWPHLGRHTRTGLDLERGLSLAHVQQQRGWSRLEHGMSYLRPSPEQTAALMEKL